MSNPLKLLTAAILEHESISQADVLAKLNLSDEQLKRRMAKPSIRFVRQLANAAGSTVEMKVVFGRPIGSTISKKILF